MWATWAAWGALRNVNTRRAYTGAINNLLQYLGCEWGTAQAMTALKRLDTKTGLKYLADLRGRTAPDGKPLADATICHRVTALRAAFEIWRTAGFFERNIWIELEPLLPPRNAYQKRPTQALDFNRVHEYLTRAAENLEDLRNQALASAAFLGGLRRSELLNLRMADIQFEAGRAIIRLNHTKARRPATVVLGGPLSQPLAAYFRHRQREGAGNEDPLWIRYRGYSRTRNQLSVSSLYRFWRRTFGVAPHSARATAATRLRSLGYSAEETAEKLRLSSSRMVTVYDKRSESERLNADSKILIDY